MDTNDSNSVVKQRDQSVSVIFSCLTSTETLSKFHFTYSQGKSSVAD